MRYQFQEKPRKVHLFHDQEGATYAGGKLFCDTLCKGNWNRRETLTTTDPEEVTCKLCLADHRMRARRKAKPVAYEVGDAITISLPKPRWWQFRRMRAWKAMQGTYHVVGCVSSTLILEDPNAR